MSRYRLQYSNEARDALRRMSAARRAGFDQAITALAADPYRHGVALGGDRDRREASLAGTVTVYLISAGVLVVSVVRIVHTD
ncbi:type II toxin-antitoxin system RelE/ParE family toxin [Streptomyces xiamenensis]|uniref:type II toxin-antitoxin system RelE family toxin n=1 Tax=Streptomyces xiamenensis TaxID=408015 RepID=UPI0036E2070F